MSITNITKRIAVFYDDKGEEIGKKSFSKTDKTFKYKGRSYNNYHDEATFTTIKRWYWDIELYHYNINNPNPMVINKKVEPILDSETYNVMLETKVIRDLNNVGAKGLLANITPLQIIIGVVILVVVYLFATGQGGKITGQG